MKKTKAIIIDLDGTLADISHRRKFVEGKKKDWKNFNAGVGDDALHLWCREIIRRMRTDHEILIVSGRVDTLKKETVNWLKKHEVHYDHLFMRKDKDFRSDDVVKKEIYLNEIEPKYEVLFVLDDRAKVVAMWRGQGLVCLQCDVGDF